LIILPFKAQSIDMRKMFLLLSVFVSLESMSQSRLDSLTVDGIMRDPKWIGTSPTNPYWSRDSKYLFFSWNPESKITDSAYFISPSDIIPQKASYEMQQDHASAYKVSYNADRSVYTYTKNGDIYVGYARSKKEISVTKTTETESDPSFLHNNRIVFTRNQNLFAWDIVSGETTQLTNFQKSNPATKDEKTAPVIAQEKWLMDDQLANFEVLRARKTKKDIIDAAQKALAKRKEQRAIYYEEKILSAITASPDTRFVTYRLDKRPTNAKNSIIPNYVTESGFTQDIPGRTKVGAPMGSSEFFVYDRVSDTVMLVNTDQVPGIKDVPDYEKERLVKDSMGVKVRPVIIYGPAWNQKGNYAVVDIRSQDNKDRWLMLLDANTVKLSLLDRQRDEAWIGGPGIGPTELGWVDDDHCWFQSEVSGYSHLYSINVSTKEKLELTPGKYEVQKVKLSASKKHFYFSGNREHPGELHFYRVPVNGGMIEKLTSMTGANNVILSPDEKYIAFLYSYSNKPWELFLQENKATGKPVQVTYKAQTAEFSSYPWRVPELINFKASDGANVFARLYRPAIEHRSRPAVIFVHGAGYLQNAHKWWSDYFREYMFHNLLADKGYTVLDIDYRGSAGYGRDWRTGIYRYMGGKDLSDNVDGAKLLVEKYGVNPKNIGIYGGSYGGFITLMAMFREQETFAAGAALRSVTDWAHYNHGYTSNILNEPFTDSLAFKKSSPIYYAAGLKGALLMCHGMVDINVHFQDIVRLAQRLIELKKENWELAVYPMEDHGFTDPSSWADEYRRILKLFETNLKK
jgi:dipeptidyl aminopeptidase/acylaminoacyl peptidase